MSKQVFEYVKKTCLNILKKSDTELRKREYGDDDVRKTFFGKINGIILSGFLSIMYLDSQLSHPKWWISTFQGPIALLAKNGKEAMYCYEGQARKSMLLGAVAVTESTMRAICRSISPGSCNNGMAEFKSIYEHVLKKVDVKPNNAVLDLSRNMRNAILHNDGVFLNCRIEKEIIEYRSKSYIFERSLPMRGLDWFLACDVTDDLFSLVSLIMQTEIISSVAKIEDIQKIDTAQHQL